MYSRNHVATECFTFLIVLLKFHKQWPYNAGVVLAKVYNAAAVVYLFLFTLCFICFYLPCVLLFLFTDLDQFCSILDSDRDRNNKKVRILPFTLTYTWIHRVTSPHVILPPTN